MLTVAAINGPVNTDYQEIPSFADWQKAELDVEGWDQAMARLSDLGEVSTDLLRRMRIIIKEAANSVGSPGRQRKSPLTETLQSAMWMAAVNEKGAEARPAIEAHLLACDYVLDAAAVKDFRISTDWIRGLHARICRTQKVYQVVTADGVRQEALRLGEYKRFPNHVPLSVKRGPCYAPVELTQAEMDKLCEELNSNAFRIAHPVLQASYALYSLLLIHPFADGNGRVARLLAMLFLYRSNSIPMLALAQKRGPYVTSLISAARGDFQPLVDFVQGRAIDAIESMEGRMRLAMS